MNDAPPADLLYIKEHPAEFPGVTSQQTTQRTYPQGQLPGAQGAYPAAQVLGYVGTINSAELKSRASQGYQAGDAFGQAGLEYQYETQLHGTAGRQELEVDPHGDVAGVLKTTPSEPGDNIVTNIDTNLQQVADSALATQVQALRNTYDPAVQQQGRLLPGRHRRGRHGDEPPDRCRLRHVVVPELQPERLGRRDLPAGLLGADRPDQQRAPAQPGDRRSVHPRVDLQAQHGDRGPAVRPLDAVDSRTTTAARSRRPGCQYNSTTCIFHNSSTGEPPAATTCRRRSRCRATTSSTTWATCSTPSPPSTAPPPSRTRRRSTAWAS